MEILHFCPSRSFSGLEQYAFQTALDQKHRGRDVAFVVCPRSTLEERCRQAGIPTVSYDPFAFWGTVRFWKIMDRLLRDEKNLRILHLHSTQELFHISVPALKNRLRGRHLPKVILQSHIWVNHKKKDVFHRALYNLVDELWCSSEEQKKSLLNSLPVPVGKIRLMKYGRDVEKMEKEFLAKEHGRRVLRLPEESLVIGTVSRIEESKGVREFLEAAADLMSQWATLNVVVIGGPSPDDEAAALYHSGLEKWLGELDVSLRKRFHLLGSIPDSYKFLKALDLYVLPSYQETFSLSLLDAQLAGLPVVGTRSGGTPDVVKEGETGWLATPKDRQDLSEKLKQALLCRDQWESFGSRAAARVRRDFNQERAFEAVLIAYDELAQDNKTDVSEA